MPSVRVSISVARRNLRTIPSLLVAGPPVFAIVIACPLGRSLRPFSEDHRFSGALAQDPARSPRRILFRSNETAPPLLGAARQRSRRSTHLRTISRRQGSHPPQRRRKPLPWSG